jgi:hypothetical protein
VKAPHGSQCAEVSRPRRARSSVDRLGPARREAHRASPPATSWARFRGELGVGGWRRAANMTARNRPTASRPANHSGSGGIERRASSASSAAKCFEIAALPHGDVAPKHVRILGARCLRRGAVPLSLLDAVSRALEERVHSIRRSAWLPAGLRRVGMQHSNAFSNWRSGSQHVVQSCERHRAQSGGVARWADGCHAL